MSRRPPSPILGAACLAALAGLAACSQEVIDGQARISDVEGPEGAQTTGVNLLFIATFEPRVWAGDPTSIGLGYSERRDRNGDGAVDAADIRTRGPEATLIFPEELADFFCEDAPGDGARRCGLRRSFPPGLYDWQWFYEHLPTTILLEAPTSPASFTVPAPAPPPPPPDDDAPDDDASVDDPPDDDAPVAALPLELRDPEDGQACVGVFPSEAGGDTSVVFRWHQQGGTTGTALPGDYQVMVETAQGPGCASLEAGSGGPLAGLLDLSNPLASVATDICDVTPANVNETAFRLALGTEHRWRVRRIAVDGTGDWTGWAGFTTHDFVSEPPAFVDPVGTNGNWPEDGDALVLGVGGAGTVNIAWAPTGCPPHADSWVLEKDGETVAASLGTLPGACFAVPNRPDLCQRSVTAQGPGDYLFRLRHHAANGTLGTVDAALSFSVAE